MKRDLETMARVQGGVFSAEEAARIGVNGPQLTTLVRAREIVRLRRGAYALTGAYENADIDHRYAMRVLAVMHSRPRTDRASHHSALTFYGVATFGVPYDTVLLESDVHRARREATAIIHPRCTMAAGGSVLGIRIIDVTVACLQVTVRYGAEAGLCAMDSAVHQEKCTPAQLQAALVHVATKWRNIVRRVIARIEPTTESIGETRTRIILLHAGFSVVPQFVIEHEGRFIARVDFLVDGCVVVEFDGLIKYAGAEGREALAAEKRRESEITWLGYEVVRVVWADLNNPVALVRKVQEAKRRILQRGVLVGQ